MAPITFRTRVGHLKAELGLKRWYIKMFSDEGAPLPPDKCPRFYSRKEAREVLREMKVMSGVMPGVRRPASTDGDGVMHGGRWRKKR
jgi:hypothetical protein